MAKTKSRNAAGVMRYSPILIDLVAGRLDQNGVRTGQAMPQRRFDHHTDGRADRGDATRRPAR